MKFARHTTSIKMFMIPDFKVIMRHLWFGEDVKQAVDASRIHHQLAPMEVSYEYGVLQVTSVF